MLFSVSALCSCLVTFYPCHIFENCSIFWVSNITYGRVCSTTQNKAYATWWKIKYFWCSDTQNICSTVILTATLKLYILGNDCLLEWNVSHFILACHKLPCSVSLYICLSSLWFFNFLQTLHKSQDLEHTILRKSTSTRSLHPDFQWGSDTPITSLR